MCRHTYKDLLKTLWIAGSQKKNVQRIKGIKFGTTKPSERQKVSQHLNSGKNSINVLNCKVAVSPPIYENHKILFSCCCRCCHGTSRK